MASNAWQQALLGQRLLPSMIIATWRGTEDGTAGFIFSMKASETLNSHQISFFLLDRNFDFSNEFVSQLLHVVRRATLRLR